MLFLFTDSLLFCSPKGNKLRVKRFILLDDMIELNDAAAAKDEESHGHSHSSTHVFEIVDNNSKTPVITRVHAESREEKEKWLKAIGDIIIATIAELTDLQRRISHSPASSSNLVSSRHHSLLRFALLSLSNPRPLSQGLWLWTQYLISSLS